MEIEINENSVFEQIKQIHNFRSNKMTKKNTKNGNQRIIFVH